MLRGRVKVMMLYPLMDSKGKIYVAVNERCLMRALFPDLGMYGSAKKKTKQNKKTQANIKRNSTARRAL